MPSLGMTSENERQGNPLVVAREPKGPIKPGNKGSVGDVALMDALIGIGAAWLILFALIYSLRRHIV